MNSRISSVVSGIKNIAYACNLVQRKFRVSYFKTISHERRWVSEEVWAYTKEEAATKIDPKLKPGHNCFVVRVITKG